MVFAYSFPAFVKRITLFRLSSGIGNSFTNPLRSKSLKTMLIVCFGIRRLWLIFFYVQSSPPSWIAYNTNGLLTDSPCSFACLHYFAVGVSILFTQKHEQYSVIILALCKKQKQKSHITVFHNYFNMCLRVSRKLVMSLKEDFKAVVKPNNAEKESFRLNTIYFMMQT